MLPRDDLSNSSEDPFRLREFEEDALFRYLDARVRLIENDLPG
jgi:hypothetical protein